MEILETIMNENLQSQYRLAAILTFMDIIDSCYDDDSDTVLKSFITVLKTYLESLYTDMDATIDKMDDYLVKNS